MVEDITDHLKMQEQFRDSEIRYRTIFENGGSAILIVEADTTISLVNTEFEPLSGFSKKEIEGKRIARDLHDSIGQSLMVIKLRVEKALHFLEILSLDAHGFPPGVCWLNAKLPSVSTNRVLIR